VARFFAALRMTRSEGLRMTESEGLRMTESEGLAMTCGVQGWWESATNKRGLGGVLKKILITKYEIRNNIKAVTTEIQKDLIFEFGFLDLFRI
jgi:hypothetical protein